MRRSKQHKLDRLTIFKIVIFVFGLLVAAKLFYLQVLSREKYEISALNARQTDEELKPDRGEIFIEEQKGSQGQLYPLATNINLFLVYVVPSEIEDTGSVVEALSSILELDKETLWYKVADKNDPYQILKHYVSDEKAQEIKNWNFKGVGFQKEAVRYYPDKELFSHVVGFVGFKDNQRIGQYGIEEYFEDKLRGKEGEIKGERDTAGRIINTSNPEVVEAKNGNSIVLTLDRAIQHMACSELAKGVEQYEAQNGLVIIAEPSTGKILALCGYPNFDPNKYNSVEDFSVFNNTALAPYEPGSVFKAVTMAAALDTDAVEPTTTYKDEGFVKIGGYTIKNVDQNKYGVQTMIQVLEKSLNTGAIFVTQQMSEGSFCKYVKDFGFGTLTGISLNGEGAGDISSLEKKGQIYTATASFGQGITVNPLQLISAFGVIANGGNLVRPYLVDRMFNESGLISQTEPQIIRRVISAETADTLSAMLVSAVKNGFGKRAQVEGYHVAGKTGTAQVPNKDKAGYSEETIHTFVGFAPVDAPRFVALIKLDKPKKERFASYTAAGIFGQIAKFVLNYYQIPRDY